jgi:DAACS family dicarboxylate/amino acid:cation (Na+ or H+) symporter
MRLKPHNALLVALLSGALLGALAHAYLDTAAIQAFSQYVLRPIGQIFLRTIFMIVVPMVVSALVIGVYELGAGHGLGRVAARTLGMTLLLSTASVIVGVAMVNSIRPGASVTLDRTALTASVTTLQENAAAARPLTDILVELIPRNPLDSAVRALDGEMLPLMIFSMIFGIAITRIPTGDDRHLLVRVFDQIFAACMIIVSFAMRFAPLAVFAIVFNTVFSLGTGILASLLLYVVTVVGGLLVQQFLVYGGALAVLARRSPLTFFRQCREVYLYAFSTASSNATLPLSLRVAEQTLQVPPRIARFVLTVGSTANQNGTALFEGVTVLFLAQVYALDLTIGQQVRVMLMSVVAGIGTAGVPGGSLPMVMIVAQSVGVPAEGMALILGVDRFLDMCRTAVNVSGDLVIAAVVGRSAGSTDVEVASAS